MFYQNGTQAGLGTYSVTVLEAGTFVVSGSMSLPRIYDGSTAASSCVVLVKQNGSTVYTGTAGADGFKAELLCAANDVISVVFQSAAAIDQPVNAIKCQISITSGV